MNVIIELRVCIGQLISVFLVYILVKRVILLHFVIVVRMMLKIENLIIVAAKMNSIIHLINYVNLVFHPVKRVELKQNA